MEICLSDEWGTVCDQMWNDTDAGVVCRQLRLASAGNSTKHDVSMIKYYIEYNYVLYYRSSIVQWRWLW